MELDVATGPLSQTDIASGNGTGESGLTRRMRILILSWRCPKHPRAGGAEAFTHEVARRLASAGHAVEWFASSYRGAQASEDLDGIKIVRAGSWITVYAHAIKRYRSVDRRQYDVILDEVNVVPFFAHAWTRLPTFALVFQLHRQVWFYQTALPLAALGFLAEPLYMRAGRRTPVLTISASTQADLRRLGYGADVKVIPVGVDHMPLPEPTKADPPAFIYVGRLVPAKRIEHIVRAFAVYRRSSDDGELWIVGTGPDRYRRSLISLIKRLQVDEHVKLFGHVPMEQKRLLMARARALVMTSVREGWGLVVTEANVCGTPAIVYDVHGLRDAVQDNLTGLIVPPKVDALAKAMVRLATDDELYGRLAYDAQERAAKLSWDETARIVDQTLNEAVTASIYR